MLLDAVEGKAHEVAQTLRNKPGVKIADMPEGPPGLIVVMQTSTHQRRAELTNKALVSVETMTYNWQLLLVQNGRNTVGHA